MNPSQKIIRIAAVALVGVCIATAGSAQNSRDITLDVSMAFPALAFENYVLHAEIHMGISTRPTFETRPRRTTHDISLRRNGRGWLERIQAVSNDFSDFLLLGYLQHQSTGEIVLVPATLHNAVQPRISVVLQATQDNCQFLLESYPLLGVSNRIDSQSAPRIMRAIEHIVLFEERMNRLHQVCPQDFRAERVDALFDYFEGSSTFFEDGDSEQIIFAIRQLADIGERTSDIDYHLFHARVLTYLVDQVGDRTFQDEPIRQVLVRELENIFDRRLQQNFLEADATLESLSRLASNDPSLCVRVGESILRSVVASEINFDTRHYEENFRQLLVQTTTCAESVRRATGSGIFGPAPSRASLVELQGGNRFMDAFVAAYEFAATLDVINEELAGRMGIDDYFVEFNS